MYFIIKYNVFYKYIINATTTAINAGKKKLFDFGQREVETGKKKSQTP